jgi:hypothetical protein
LELAAAAQPSAHGPVGYAAVASSNVAEALEVVAQYGSVRVRGMDFRLAGPLSHGRSPLSLEAPIFGEDQKTPRKRS